MNKVLSLPFLRSLFVKQNKWHKHSVLFHTIKVTYHLIRSGNYNMIAAGLLHDIGKPFTADQSKDDDVLNDTYSFKNHEEISFQIIKNWWFVSDYTKNLVRYHYLIRDMSKSKINDLKRYNRLKKVWDKLPDEFKADLNIFLICDDLGK